MKGATVTGAARQRVRGGSSAAAAASVSWLERSWSERAASSMIAESVVL